MSRIHAVGIWLVPVLGLIACAPATLPAATPPESPTRRVWAFASMPAGPAPAAFVDVGSEGPTPHWLYGGNWRIADNGEGVRVLLHDDVRPQLALSFLRYGGELWGQPDGRLPSRYHAEVTVRPIDSPMFNPPTGDQGIPFYFLDIRNYVEVVVRAEQLEVWEARGAEPGTMLGWKRLWAKPTATAAGQRRRLGATVDMARGRCEVFLDGVSQTTVESPLIQQRAAWFALRANGNIVHFEHVWVEKR